MQLVAVQGKPNRARASVVPVFRARERYCCAGSLLSTAPKDQAGTTCTNSRPRLCCRSFAGPGKVPYGPVPGWMPPTSGKGIWSKGVDVVERVAAEQRVLIVKVLIDPSIESVGALGSAGGENKIIGRELAPHHSRFRQRNGKWRRIQLQVVQADGRKITSGEYRSTCTGRARRTRGVAQIGEVSGVGFLVRGRNR